MYTQTVFISVLGKGGHCPLVGKNKHENGVVNHCYKHFAAKDDKTVKR